MGVPGSDWKAGAPKSLAGLRMLLTGSDVDDWIPEVSTHEAAHLFRELGADVQMRIYKGRPHIVSEEEIDEARSFQWQPVCDKVIEHETADRRSCWHNASLRRSRRTLGEHLGHVAAAAAAFPAPRPARIDLSTPNAPAPPRPVAIASFHNQTLRMIAHTSIGGRRVRIELSNAFGSAPLVDRGGAYRAARQGIGVVPASDRALLFSGKPSCWIPPGATEISDAVNLDVPAGERSRGEHLHSRERRGGHHARRRIAHHVYLQGRRRHRRARDRGCNHHAIVLLPDERRCAARPPMRRRS